MEELRIAGGSDFDKGQQVYEEYNFTGNPEEILQALIASKQDEKMIGLVVPHIGAGLFITAVDDVIITDTDEPVIILKQYDMTGSMLERSKIKLSEIISACVLQSKWINPYFKTIVHDNIPILKAEDRL